MHNIWGTCRVLLGAPHRLSFAKGDSRGSFWAPYSGVTIFMLWSAAVRLVMLGRPREPERIWEDGMQTLNHTRIWGEVRRLVGICEKLVLGGH